MEIIESLEQDNKEYLLQRGQYYRLKITDAKNIVPCFISACTHGELNVMKLLYSKYSDEINTQQCAYEIMKTENLMLVIHSKNMEVFALILSMFPVHEKNLFNDMPKLIKVIMFCVSENALDMIEYIFFRDLNKILQTKLDEIYAKACEYGRQEIVKWLLSIPENNIIIGDKYFLENICSSGNDCLFNYIYSQLPIGNFFRSDIGISELLSSAVSSGNIELVKYIYIKSSSVDITVRKNCTFNACVKGNVKMLQYLQTLDLVEIDDYIFEQAYKIQNYEICDMLWNSVPQSTDSETINKYVKSSLIPLCKTNDWEQLEKIIVRFPSANIQFCDDYIFRFACLYGNLKMAQYIQSLILNFHESNNAFISISMVCSSNNIELFTWLCDWLLSHSIEITSAFVPLFRNIISQNKMEIAEKICSYDSDFKITYFSDKKPVGNYTSYKKIYVSRDMFLEYSELIPMCSTCDIELCLCKTDCGHYLCEKCLNSVQHNKIILNCPCCLRHVKTLFINEENNDSHS
jgi:hypothetical protein